MALVVCSACAGPTAVLDSRGAAADSVAKLWWLMLALATAVLLAVVAAFLPTLRQKRSVLPPQRHKIWLRGTIVAAALILTSVYIATEATMSRLHAMHDDHDLVVHVTGWQWWWEVKYSVPGSGDTITSANEIHIPVGRHVKVTVTSGDVIHSLWVPNLAGKIDLVPGRTHSLTLHAARPGVSHAPCAEYCGIQHAHMMLLVIAREQSDFDAWFARERLAAVAPTDSLQQAGAAVFARVDCDYCHMVRGTTSLGKLGPDLTHFASRRAIAAGKLPNNAQNLAAWLHDPQGVKPGTRMPAVPLTPSDLSAVVAYLAALR